MSKKYWFYLLLIVNQIMGLIIIVTDSPSWPMAILMASITISSGYFQYKIAQRSYFYGSVVKVNAIIAGILFITMLFLK